MLKDTIIRFSTAVILLLLFSCTKSEKKQVKNISETESLSDFVSESQIIRDSIKKLKNYNLEFIICTQSKTKDHNIIEFTHPCLPFYIDREYYFKSIDGVNIIFYNYKKPLISKKPQKSLENLMKKNLVKIGTDNMTCCIMPFYYFAICNNDSKIMNCYSQEMLYKKETQYRESDKDMRTVESSFYPKCDQENYR